MEVGIFLFKTDFLKFDRIARVALMRLDQEGRSIGWRLGRVGWRLYFLLVERVEVQAILKLLPRRMGEANVTRSSSHRCSCG